MAWRYVNVPKSPINYICLSTDTKLAGDVGSRLFTSDNGQHFLNVDGTATGWVAYVDPKLQV